MPKEPTRKPIAIRQKTYSQPSILMLEVGDPISDPDAQVWEFPEEDLGRMLLRGNTTFATLVTKGEKGERDGR